MYQLEPIIHWLDYKEDWREAGFTREILIEKKRKHMENFKPVLDFFDEVVEYLVSNDYID